MTYRRTLNEGLNLDAISARGKPPFTYLYIGAVIGSPKAGLRLFSEKFFNQQRNVVGDTMFGSLSPEARAAEMVRNLRLTNTTVAILCHIETSKLSLALRQLKAFTPDEAKRVLTTLSRLTEIQNAIAPLSAVDSPEHARMVLGAFSGVDAEEIRKRVSVLFDGKLKVETNSSWQ